MTDINFVKRKQTNWKAYMVASLDSIGDPAAHFSDKD